MTVDYKPLAAAPGANVVSQAAYVALLAPGGALEEGFQSGTAKSEEVNKTLRQASMVAAATATAISEILGVDVLDDGDLVSLTAKLKAAITAAAWTTGDGKLTMKAVADTGWVLMNDGTIGNAGSGATTRANADTLALYSLLWNNVSQTYATVSTGRGANAAADFAALKTITLTKQLGRAIMIAGQGSLLTLRALGESLGAEDAIVVSHNHGGTLSGSAAVDAQFFGGGSGPGLAPTGQGLGNIPQPVSVTIPTAGTSGTGKNMQPSTGWNIMIKL